MSPLLLPQGLIPRPLVIGPDPTLASVRVTAYRFDVLTMDESKVGALDSVQPGGSVEFHAYSSIKGSGKITVTDLNGDVDWLNVRVRPMALISRIGVADVPIEVACGVFLPSAPVENWTATGRTWDVELLDKLSILDQDIVTDGSGNPITFTAQAGANVIEQVVALIEGAGEPAPAIQSDSKVLPNALVWDTGTTRLKIINDLLAAANYFSLWCDGTGQYQATPYVEPADRVPVYESSMPFSKSDLSLMSPDWTRDRDIYSVPNRYVAISQGDGTTESLTSVATNIDPTSPFSYSSRGRWITHVETGVEAVNQTVLDARAKLGLTQASSVTSGIVVSHLFLPDLLINSTIRFRNPDADVDILTSVIITTIPFDPTALCRSELREVAIT